MSRRLTASAPGWAALVWVGLACQEVGAALAVTLFPAAGPLGMVALRLAFSAIVLLAAVRPRLRGHPRSAWWAAARLGAALAVMNGFFYLALERIDLGVAVTIEVLGPLVLSVVVARRAVAWVWAVVAFAGVAALGAGGWDRLDPWGVVFALAAAASWAAYIRASTAVGDAFPRLDGLAFAFSFGAILALPVAFWTTGSALLAPEILGLGLAVAVLSSAIPYALELLALRRLSQAAFGILMSLAPATAALAGWILLGQRLAWLEIIGLGLVVIASAGAVFVTPRRPGGPAAGHGVDTGPLPVVR